MSLLSIAIGQVHANYISYELFLFESSEEDGLFMLRLDFQKAVLGCVNPNCQVLFSTDVKENYVRS